MEVADDGDGRLHIFYEGRLARQVVVDHATDPDDVIGIEVHLEMSNISL